MNVPHFINLLNSTADGHMGCSHFVAIMNNAINIHVQLSELACFQFS